MKKSLILRVLLMFSIFILNNIESEAYQYVKIIDGVLMTDYDMNGEYEPYLVKGVGYSPDPIGTFPSQWGMCRYTGMVEGEPQFDCGGSVYDDTRILDRDLPLIKSMNANVIRTWGSVTPELLEKLNEYNLKVIAGFWIPYHLDFVNGDMTPLINEFSNYVTAFKDDPSILGWGLGNENNIQFCSLGDSSCDRDEQAKAFYALANEMARIAHEIEGDDYHPVILIHAELGDIGDNILGADDNSLNYIDVHGVNSYRGKNFGQGTFSLFTQFESRSDKPVLITEFGTDAWYVLNPDDPSNGVERLDLQAENVGSAWDDIVHNSVYNEGPGIGGVVFVYSDGWWKDKGEWSPTCATHDYGYLPGWNGGQPDGVPNEEWWGIMAIEKNSDPSGIDIVSPRPVYTTLQKRFAVISAGKTTNQVKGNWHFLEFGKTLYPPFIAIASLLTYDGRDTADVRIRELSSSSMQVKIEEEQSKDDEVYHTTEEVGFLLIENGLIYDKDETVIGESGSASVSQEGEEDWKIINFKHPYEEPPVVFIQVASYNDTEPAHIRLRNITNSTAEFKVEEWNYQDGYHSLEDISYLVVEKGIHVLPDNTYMEVGIADVNHNWQKLSYLESFSDQPMIVSRCQTNNGSQAVVTRLKRISTSSFKVRLQEEEGSDYIHSTERIGYAAIGKR